MSLIIPEKSRFIVLMSLVTCKVQLNLVYVPRHQILEILEPQDVLVINVLNIPEKFIFKRTKA
jgi:hypothetical protein